MEAVLCEEKADVVDLWFVRRELRRLVLVRQHWSEKDAARYALLTDYERRLLFLAASESSESAKRATPHLDATDEGPERFGETEIDAGLSQSRIREERDRRGQFGEWLWRYPARIDTDAQGHRVFLFRRRVAGTSFDCIDVLVAVSIAVAVAETTGTAPITVDHAEIRLGEEDAGRLSGHLSDKARWPKWCVAAELVEGPPNDDSDVTVVLFERR